MLLAREVVSIPLVLPGPKASRERGSFCKSSHRLLKGVGTRSARLTQKMVVGRPSFRDLVRPRPKGSGALRSHPSPANDSEGRAWD